jgi:lipoprotein-anchoring transpeptidase ErfK/SrfK
MNTRLTSIVAAGFVGLAFAAAGTLLSGTVQAQVLAMATEQNATANVTALPPRGASSDIRQDMDVSVRLGREVVDYPTTEPAGTVIVDTPHTYLYFVLGSGRAIRYGIGVGREGFTWSGTKTVERKTEWPDWYPPADMLQRQPYLPRFMAGGPGNPLGARAIYLSGTLYRIHGTNKPSSIGTHVSSGCIRMLNADVIDLYQRTHVGTKVVVLPLNDRHVAQLVTSSPLRTRKPVEIFDESVR